MVVLGWDCVIFISQFPVVIKGECITGNMLFWSWNPWSYSELTHNLVLICVYLVSFIGGKENNAILKIDICILALRCIPHIRDHSLLIQLWVIIESKILVYNQTLCHDSHNILNYKNNTIKKIWELLLFCKHHLFITSTSYHSK